MSPKDELLRLIERKADRILAEKVVGPMFFGDGAVPAAFVDAIERGDMSAASREIWSRPSCDAHPDGLASLLKPRRRR